ncbi:MAG TPA: SURF1 family protein [Usitatibacter sp.]|nr:SURF1 family protein [Usitatibacter sp.]
MRIGSWTFAPRLVPTLAAAAFIALTGSLSRWQAHRAQEKDRRQHLYEERMAQPPLDLAGRVDSEAILFRRVRADGTWIARKQVFVDNQVQEGRAGFDVVTPLRIEPGGAVVLVDRGWVARTAAYPEPPRVEVPAGRVEVQGIAALPPARFLELQPSEAIIGSVFQNLSLERYRKWSGIDVLPVEVFADPAGPGLLAVHEQPDAGADQNRQYEATWFLLAATAAALWVGLNLRRAQ